MFQQWIIQYESPIRTGLVLHGEVRSCSFNHRTAVIFMGESHGTRNLAINDGDGIGYLMYPKNTAHN